MLEDVVDVLACPHCGAGLTLSGGSLRCAENHLFDLARQGYVSLLSAHGRTSGDTAAMVAARAGFLRAGHFVPIAELVAESVTGGGCVLDVGAGTGYYLARVLDQQPGRTGLAVDLSKYACRRSAKAHPHIGAAVADAWQRLPMRSGTASAVLDVFAPRNAAEMHRVLAPGGQLVVVTPDVGHLAELIPALGLLSVDERKQERLDAQLGELFEPVRQRPVEFTMSLAPEEVWAVVAMGPSARHTTPDELRERLSALPDPVRVSASVTVSAYRTRLTKR